jgi:hypothetical protein
VLAQEASAPAGLTHCVAGRDAPRSTCCLGCRRPVAVLAGGTPAWRPTGPRLIGSATALGLPTLLAAAPLLVVLARQLAAGGAYLQLRRRGR